MKKIFSKNSIDGKKFWNEFDKEENKKYIYPHYVDEDYKRHDIIKFTVFGKTYYSSRCLSMAYTNKFKVKKAITKFIKIQKNDPNRIKKEKKIKLNQLKRINKYKKELKELRRLLNVLNFYRRPVYDKNDFKVCEFYRILKNIHEHECWIYNEEN